MDISVIVCTWNNEGNLSDTLSSFCGAANMVDVRWELIVVDNNSDDNTKDVVMSFLDKLPVVYVYEVKQGLSYARNKGLGVAKGDLIIFTDDDVRPVGKWLQVYWDAYCEKPEGHFFGGPVFSCYEDGPPATELLKYAPASVKGLSRGPSNRLLNPREYFLGANWACPRKHLVEVEGFDVRLGLNPSGNRVMVSEETDLMDRLRSAGLAGLYLADAEIGHVVPSSKCTLNHIAARKEAEAYSSEIRGKESSNVIKACIRMVRSGIGYAYFTVVAGITRPWGGKWKNAYIRSRICRGRFLGIWKRGVWVRRSNCGMTLEKS